MVVRAWNHVSRTCYSRAVDKPLGPTSGDKGQVDGTVALTCKVDLSEPVGAPVVERKVGGPAGMTVRSGGVSGVPDGSCGDPGVSKRSCGEVYTKGRIGISFGAKESQEWLSEVCLMFIRLNHISINARFARLGTVRVQRSRTHMLHPAQMDVPAGKLEPITSTARCWWTVAAQNMCGIRKKMQHRARSTQATPAVTAAGATISETTPETSAIAPTTTAMIAVPVRNMTTTAERS